MLSPSISITITVLTVRCQADDGGPISGLGGAAALLPTGTGGLLLFVWGDRPSTIA